MNGQPLEILVVESDTAVAAAIGAALRRRGHRVTLAENAEEAALLPTPELMVCEIELPDMDGLSLLETLREQGSTTRAVFVTGQPTHENCRRALRLGASELLAKPFRLEELIEAIESSRPTPAPALPAAATAKPTGAFHRTIPVDEESADRCVRELASFLVRSGLGPSTRARIATACAEVLDNARRHAYPEAAGSISLDAELDGSELVVHVTDSGTGFDPVAAAVGPMCNPVESGLARARALAEQIRIETAPGRGTHIELRFFAFRTCFEGENTIDLSELDWLPPHTARRILESLRRDPSNELYQLSPALAVSVGRMLSAPTGSQNVQTALWS